ncbi:MAG: hypothetical protein AABW50_05825 [Nanoarchaeota archaeon]
MKVISSHEKENLLFKRKEIIISIKANSIPSKTAAEELISEKFSASRENIRIKKIKGSFGSNKFNIAANVYHSKRDKEATEIISKKEKENEAKSLAAAKTAEQAKEQKTEEEK